MYVYTPLKHTAEFQIDFQIKTLQEFMAYHTHKSKWISNPSSSQMALAYDNNNWAFPNYENKGYFYNIFPTINKSDMLMIFSKCSLGRITDTDDIQ